MGLSISPDATAAPVYASDREKTSGDVRSSSPTGTSVSFKRDHTHRNLKARHIQLIGIGGTIGTALFVGNILGVKDDYLPRRPALPISPGAPLFPSGYWHW